jgi:exodeoxyribonuclease VII large subunit
MPRILPPLAPGPDTVFLAVPFKDNAQVRGLGAQFHGPRKQWYVPDGLDLEPFRKWIPAMASATAPAPGTAITVRSVTPLVVAKPYAAKLSELLARVNDVMSRAFPLAEWVTAETTKVNFHSSSGHVYIEFSESDAGGQPVARAQAVIWRGNTAVIRAFQNATGIELGPNLKLMVRARPTVSSKGGLMLVIEEINPAFTLGDLEARKREIRQRLKEEGVFQANKRLPEPWDYNAVLVVAPPEAASLGDFVAESHRLERLRLCTFTVVSSRFQGEGAAAEIRQALEAGLAEWPGDGLPDAVVIIRGGGAPDHLAWLNDYALARFICDCPVPVLTGIGHAPDETVLDEVAHRKYDTPSKVIKGIEDCIARRANTAQEMYDQILEVARNWVQRADARLERAMNEVSATARDAVSDAKLATERVFIEVERGARAKLARADVETNEQFGNIQAAALGNVDFLGREVETLFGEVREGAYATLRTADALVDDHLPVVLKQARRDMRQMSRECDAHLRDVELRARQAVAQANRDTEALMFEVLARGPEQTLARGFAMVRAPDEDNRIVMQADSVAAGERIAVVMRDGTLEATVDRFQPADAGGPNVRGDEQ